MLKDIVPGWDITGREEIRKNEPAAKTVMKSIDEAPTS